MTHAITLTSPRAGIPVQPSAPSPATPPHAFIAAAPHLQINHENAGNAFQLTGSGG